MGVFLDGELGSTLELDHVRFFEVQLRSRSRGPFFGLQLELIIRPVFRGMGKERCLVGGKACRDSLEMEYLTIV